MRRGFSILLVLLFGLGPLSAALGANDDSSLPACCRRHGEHHCAMTLSAGAMGSPAPDSTPSFTAPPRCPLFPGFTAGPLTPAHALAVARTNLPALLEQKLAIASIAPHAPIRLVCTPAGRGPPERTPTDKLC